MILVHMGRKKAWIYFEIRDVNIRKTYSFLTCKRSCCMRDPYLILTSMDKDHSQTCIYISFPRLYVLLPHLLNAAMICQWYFSSFHNYYALITDNDNKSLHFIKFLMSLFRFSKKEGKKSWLIWREHIILI